MGTTAAEALDKNGFTGEQLMKLSRKAAVDALRRHDGHFAARVGHADAGKLFERIYDRGSPRLG